MTIYYVDDLRATAWLLNVKYVLTIPSTTTQSKEKTMVTIGEVGCTFLGSRAHVRKRKSEDLYRYYADHVQNEEKVKRKMNSAYDCGTSVIVYPAAFLLSSYGLGMGILSFGFDLTSQVWPLWSKRLSG